MSKYYLIPGNNGKDCVGNGHFVKSDGTQIRCRCGNCKFKVCCINNSCDSCTLKKCPRKKILKYIRGQKRKRKLGGFIDKLITFCLYAPYPEAFIEEFLQ